MRTELGHYTVNGIIFPNKIQAILEAQKTNADINWYFFDDTFNKVDWTIEPSTSLETFYKMRAQQIRDAYDYVIIMCSGGADSTNMVKSFLENGIHVDEVIAMAPMSGLSNFDWNDKDTSTENTASETKFAQMPLMHEIATNYPSVKTTLLDSFKDILHAETDDWILNCQGDVINSWTHTHSRLDQYKNLVDMAENGKRIAVVNGIDKPVLSVLPGGNIITLFSDVPINLPKQPFKKDYPNVDRVLFYWSADLPEMVVKQCHVIAREIHKPENIQVYEAMISLGKLARDRERRVLSLEQAMLKMLPSNRHKWKNSTKNQYNAFSVYERGIVPFIYAKTYKKELFQANKIDPTHTFFALNHDWFHKLHGNTRANQLFESDFLNFYKSIDAKYLNESKTGFKPNRKWFFIGHISKFKGKQI
jgi:hypothetical protein